MRCCLRLVLLAVAIWVATSISAGSAASADGGACGVTAGRPACTILLGSPDRSARERTTVGWGQECIVLVAGLGSPTDGSDAGFFTEVLGDLARSIDHRLVRFGVDRGAFDTTAAISRSAGALRSVIRSLSADCDAIHVVAHSMGGVVADRALAKGDPAADGVVTYTALASPHNGATAARALVPAVEEDVVFAAALGAIGPHDPREDAVRDLARTHPPRPLRDVAEVRLRLVTDEFVLRRDNADRRFDVREFLPSALEDAEGHGRIVHDPAVQEVVRATIVGHHTPAETRSTDELAMVARIGAAIDEVAAALEWGAGVDLLAASRATHLALGSIEALVAPAK